MGQELEREMICIVLIFADFAKLDCLMNSRIVVSGRDPIERALLLVLDDSL